jgi:hypothetical protein
MKCGHEPVVSELCVGGGLLWRRAEESARQREGSSPTSERESVCVCVCWLAYCICCWAVSICIFATSSGILFRIGPLLRGGAWR